MSNPGIITVARSENSKIGKVAATYASQVTCPKSCPFMGQGCYAESGPMGIHTSRLNRQAGSAGLSKLQMARNEAAAIDNMLGDLPLRLHVVGDSTTNQTARLVAGAAGRYRARNGQAVWSYTHAWRQVRRASWGDVSVLASCETLQDAKLAHERGYAAAVVVAHHQQDTAHIRDGVRVIPCPQQTGKSADCMSCGLCMRADWLHESKTVIEFATHGGGMKRATAAVSAVSGLNIIQ